MKVEAGYTEVEDNFTFAQLKKKGDDVRGVYLGMRKFNGQFGEQDVIMIRLSENDVRGVSANDSLLRLIEKVGVGASIHIVWNQKIETSAGFKMNSYKLFARPATGQSKVPF